MQEHRGILVPHLNETSAGKPGFLGTKIWRSIKGNEGTPIAEDDMTYLFTDFRRIEDVNAKG
jgi:hypothetical protein